MPLCAVFNVLLTWLFVRVNTIVTWIFIMIVHAIQEQFIFRIVHVPFTPFGVYS